MKEILEKLAGQIGTLSVNLTVTQVELEEARKQISDLQGQVLRLTEELASLKSDYNKEVVEVDSVEK